MNNTSGGNTLNMVFTVKSILKNEVVLDLVGTGDAKVKGVMTVDRASGVVLKNDIVTTIESQGLTTTVKIITTKK